MARDKGIKIFGAKWCVVVKQQGNVAVCLHKQTQWIRVTTQYLIQPKMYMQRLLV
jgi:hypothetical protein